MFEYNIQKTIDLFWNATCKKRKTKLEPLKLIFNYKYEIFQLFQIYLKVELHKDMDR